MTVGPANADSLGVPLTNLDEPLFEGAGATKRDLINYLDGVAGRRLVYRDAVVRGAERRLIDNQ